LVRNLHMQLRVALLMADYARFIDTWIFFFGGDGLVIPMLVAKLTRKNTILAPGASDEQMMQAGDDRLYKLVKIASGINRRLSDRLVVYSPRLVNEWHLETYRPKVLIAHHHFVDFTTFRSITSIKDRK